jgi:hypothetical protein
VTSGFFVSAGRLEYLQQSQMRCLEIVNCCDEDHVDVNHVTAVGDCLSENLPKGMELPFGLGTCSDPTSPSTTGGRESCSAGVPCGVVDPVRQSAEIMNRDPSPTGGDKSARPQRSESADDRLTGYGDQAGQLLLSEGNVDVDPGGRRLTMFLGQLDQ